MMRLAPFSSVKQESLFKVFAKYPDGILTKPMLEFRNFRLSEWDSNSLLLSISFLFKSTLLELISKHRFIRKYMSNLLPVVISLQVGLFDSLKLYTEPAKLVWNLLNIVIN